MTYTPYTFNGRIFFLFLDFPCDDSHGVSLINTGC